MNNKNHFVNITFYVYLIWALFLILSSLFSLPEPVNFAVCLVILIPILIMKLLKQLSTKYKWKKILTNLLVGALAVVTLFLFLFIRFLIYIDHNVPRFYYKNELKSLKNHYGKDKFSHFPDKIPSIGMNYHFHVEHAWDDSVDLLYFDADNEYIDKIINKHKNKCKIKGKKSDVFAEYLYPHIGEADDEDILCMFNEPSYKDRYLAGYLVNKKKNRIYFFFECW